MDESGLRSQRHALAMALAPRMFKLKPTVNHDSPPRPNHFPERGQNEARTRRFAARALVLSPGAQRSPRKRAVPEGIVAPIPRKD